MRGYEVEWIQALQVWVKVSAPYAPAAVIAAILAAFMPKRDASIPGSVLGALVATPMIGLTFVEIFPTYKLTSQAVGAAGGVSIYWILAQVPTIWHAVVDKLGLSKSKQ